VTAPAHDCSYAGELGAIRVTLPRHEEQLRDHELRLRDHGRQLAQFKGALAAIAFAGSTVGGLVAVLVERWLR